MGRVLVVDASWESPNQIAHALSNGGHEVVVARTIADASSIIDDMPPDIVLGVTDASVNSSDFFDLSNRPRFDGERILALPEGSLQEAVQAAKQGVYDCVRTPLVQREVLEAVEGALRHLLIRRWNAARQPVLHRWASMVSTAVRADADPRTVSEWSRLLGVSRPTLEKICRLVDISAKSSLDLARLVRAASQAHRYNCPLEIMLNCDLRTLRRLCRIGRLCSDIAVPGVCSLEAFLDRQRFITNPFALAALRHELSDRVGPLRSLHGNPSPVRTLHSTLIESKNGAARKALSP